MALIKGKEIAIGSETFIIPPLNFRQLEEHADALASFAEWDKSPNPYKEMKHAVPVILSAVQRNYPEMTEDKLTDMVDLGNYRDIFEAIMGVSGIRDTVAPLGELKPAVGPSA